jgi:TonB-dependent SusC/RagA subfamily outer membrane receptor
MLQISFYLLKVLLCSGILLGYYWFTLRNKIYHHYNRFFLLASVVLALVLPLMEINIWHYADEPKSQAIQLLQVVTSSDEYINDIAVNAMPEYFTVSQLLTVVYFLVSMIFLVAFIRVLWIIRTLIYKYRGQVVERFFFVNTDAKGTPFSFLNYIFWNEAIDLDSTTGRQIFRHEVAHVQEKHSYDKLFINVVLIFCWCNPFFWIIRKELNMIHEFIADKKAVEDNDTAGFAAMILQAAYPKHRFELTNNFFYSPIKRRLLMLTKNQNPKVSYFSRILVLPLAVLVFAAFTLKTKTIGLPQQGTIASGKKITVVLDAGHGGKDAGGFGKDGVLEKDMSLAIVQKIKQLNSNESLNIILTRETDVYLSPPERVAFAKAQNADLFISIHLDSAPASESESKNGMTVWVAKNESGNTNVSRQLASAIIGSFKNNYALAVPDNPMQRTKGIWVLQANECPSVLIEAGYISNSKDAAYLRTDAAKEAIARNILAAINNYAAQKLVTATAPADTLPEVVVTGRQVKANSKVTGGSANDLDSSKPNDIYSIDVKKSNDIIVNYGSNGSRTLTIKTQPKSPYGTKEPEPLYVLNGTIIDKAQLDKMDPGTIDHINVLKDANATKYYGDKGRNGVVEITTKPQIVKGFKAGTLSVKGDMSSMGNNPLLIMDGVEMAGKSKKEIANILGNNNNIIIELAGPANAIKSRYGKKAADGLIIVTTKKEAAASSEPVTVTGYAAKPVVEEGGQNIIFTKVEQEAQFPGDVDAWRKYLAKSLDATVPVKEGWKKGVYYVNVQFITDKDGNISDVKALNYQSSKTAQACIDIVKNGPRWEPAMQNGHKVKAYRNQPITFVIEE